LPNPDLNGNPNPSVFSLASADPAHSASTPALTSTPQSYTITEGTVANYSLTSISCVGADGVTPFPGATYDIPNRTASFQITQTNGLITCTFNNAQSFSVTVNKTLVPSNDPGTFNLAVNSSNVATGVGNGG